MTYPISDGWGLRDDEIQDAAPHMGFGQKSNNIKEYGDHCWSMKRLDTSSATMVALARGEIK
ncbi:uncharacterized protein G2W53_038016 [Senna tora]|uniref:Uncharacterized protein n=1 Tax=Senna tora TaxID=362788 RepID=A0A834SK83_9FABA|nr:uncharacterized protein G2W53_038016 [Senna tora]